MKISTVSLGLSGLAVGVLAALLFTQAAPPVGQTAQPSTETSSRQSGKALIGGPFSLVNQKGERVSDKDFLGKYMLVFFGFTNCPDICPSGLQVMTAALDKLGKRSEQVTPVLITFDAERDTPEKLAEYAKSFHPRLVALTGTPAELAAAAKAYRVYYQKVDDEKTAGRYSYDHSAIFYLMGPDGAFVTHVPHTNDADVLARALDKAIS